MDKCTVCCGSGKLIIPLETQPIYESLSCPYCNNGERIWIDEIMKPYSKEFYHKVYISGHYIETLTINRG